MSSTTEVGHELDALLCFDLYAASRAVTAAYRPILEDLGVTYPQYLVLVVLWGRDECAVKDLAATLRLDHATLTPLLRRMEQAGLVTRRRSTADERVVLVALTAAGEAMRPEAERVQCRVAEALGVTAEQAVTLRDLLRGVTASAGRSLEG
ncbi:MAG: MarR family transcriptional regulator [Nocardioides sp.]|uniref:MarR family winged helix-turn-helix transcriptional regulator n=1 Tax=Nocardioides kribbensis TaxID=305517 RepID=UPI001A35CDB2|nr:MarR family transcriptional regulator [Nocardioides sp.]